MNRISNVQASNNSNIFATKLSKNGYVTIDDVYSTEFKANRFGLIPVIKLDVMWKKKYKAIDNLSEDSKHSIVKYYSDAEQKELKRKIRRHGMSFNSILYNILIGTIAANGSEDNSYTGTNKFLLESIKSRTELELQECDIKRELNRLSQSGLITIYVNLLIATRGYTAGEYTTAKHGDKVYDTIIDNTKNFARTIVINTDKLISLTSIVDLQDPEFLKLSPRSRERKFAKQKLYVHKEGIKNKFKETKVRLKVNDTTLNKSMHYNVESVNAAIGYFVYNESQKHYDMSSSIFMKYPVFTNKNLLKRKYAIEKNGNICWVDDETGEVVICDKNDHSTFENLSPEEKSILDLIWSYLPEDKYAGKKNKK